MKMTIHTNGIVFTDVANEAQHEMVMYLAEKHDADPIVSDFGCTITIKIDNLDDFISDYNSQFEK